MKNLMRTFCFWTAAREAEKLSTGDWLEKIEKRLDETNEKVDKNTERIEELNKKVDKNTEKIERNYGIMQGVFDRYEESAEKLHQENKQKIIAIQKHLKLATV